MVIWKHTPYEPVRFHQTIFVSNMMYRVLGYFTYVRLTEFARSN